MGLLLAYAIRISDRQYEDPMLHSGKWSEPKLLGSNGQQRVLWERQEPVKCSGGRHSELRCYIGPGVAHMDECVCGATRSGVYGEWLPSHI
jgi:hypothetical protein